MVPIDRSCVTFCQSAVVSIAVFCTTFETLDVEEYRDLKILVRGHSPCEFMHDGYIAEIYRLGTIFLLLTFKFIEIGKLTNRKPVCDFL